MGGSSGLGAVVGAMNMLEHDGAVAAQRARPAARCPKGFNANTAAASSALIPGDRTIFTIFGSLHLLLSDLRTKVGCKQGINSAERLKIILNQVQTKRCVFAKFLTLHIINITL